MSMGIIFVGCITAVFIALIFFGITSKKEKKSAGITDIATAEQTYNAYMKKHGRCTVIYIGVFYESLKSSSNMQEKLKARFEIEEVIENFCSLFGGVAARVDESNYIILSGADKSTAKKFCKDLNTHESEKTNIINVNTGVYISEELNDEFETVGGYAKKAARYAKSQKFDYFVCGKGRLAKIIEAENIDNNIEKFIEKDSFYQLYQPFCDCKTKKICGVEPFARLKGVDGREIVPSKFLNTIKRENLYRKFDLYTYDKSCSWLKKSDETDLYMACNFSRSTLTSDGICDDILSITKKHGINPKQIIVGITDEYISKGFETLKDNITQLKKYGFKICIDNFGNINTSLSDLSSLSPDIIGVDKRSLDNESDNNSVFDSTVKLAKSIGAKVLCEGIETKKQADDAANSGCDIMQGYYFHKPMSIGELDKLLKNRNNV